MTGRLAYRVPEAAEQIGLSERATWRLIQSGQLIAIRAGRATLVPAVALEAWITLKLNEQGAAGGLGSYAAAPAEAGDVTHTLR